ncbi:MAG: O-antigen ligase family protein [Actinobacteria bacterium]|nr:O-antigen ligase family protein [Actinomycetota bacterium]
MENRHLNRSHIPYVIAALLGLMLLLVANTAGAGEFRWRFVLYVALFLLSLAIAVYGYLSGNRLPADHGFITTMAVFAALLLLSALSLAWGRSLYEGIQELLLLGAFLLALITGYLLLRQRGTLQLFMGMVVAVSASLCVYGLMQYFFFFNDFMEFMARHGMDYVITDRVNSRFITPNVFAGFLNIAIPITVALILIEKRKALAWLWGGALSLQLICLYLTQSRGGWIVFALLVVLLAIMIPNADWRRRWVILLIMVVLAISLSFLVSLHNPMEGTYRGSNQDSGFGEEYSGLDVTAAAGSLRGRFAIWRGGLDMFSHNLAGGVGAGSFGLAMQQYQYHAYFSTRAHNYLLDTGAETGIAGLLLVSLLSLLILLRIRAVYKRGMGGDKKIVAVVLWAAAAGFLAHNLFDISWFNPLTGAVLWLCVGGLFAITAPGMGWTGDEGAEKEQENEGRAGEETLETQRTSRFLTTLLAVASVILLAFSVYLASIFFMAETFKEGADDHDSLGEVQEAVEDYERALEYYEADPGVHQRLGYLYLNMYVSGEEEAEKGEYTERSMYHLERAIELEPENAYPHLSRGLLLLNLDMHAEGRVSLEEAQRICPNNPAAFYFEGESYLHELEYDLALQEYAKAIELFPYYTERSIVPFRERSELVYILMSVQRSVEIYIIEGQGERALAVADEALALVPEEDGMHYMRGLALESLGRLREALEEFEYVLEQKPQAGGVHLRMGRIYRQLGELQKAEEMLRLELQYYPENEEAREELKSLLGEE